MNRSIRQAQKQKGPVFCLIHSFLCLFFLSLALPAFGEPKDWSRDQDKDLPIMVRSDRMVSSQKENKIIFYGNVEAVRGEITLHSDELEVYNAPAGGKTEKIIAKGNVVVDGKDRHATGNRAVYYDVTQRIILTGNPRAWEGENQIVGDEMIFLIKEDKFIVKSSKKKGQQVSLTLNPKKK